MYNCLLATRNIHSPLPQYLGFKYNSISHTTFRKKEFGNGWVKCLIDCTSSRKEDKIQLTHALTQQSVKCQSLQKLPNSFHYLIFPRMGLTQMTLSKQFEHNKMQCLLNRRPATYSEALYRPHAIVITKPGSVTPLPYIHISYISIPSKNERYRNHENRPCDVIGTLLSDKGSVAVWHVTAQSSYSVQRS